MNSQNVAETYIAIATEVGTKSTDVLFELIKISMERERNAKLTSDKKPKIPSGGEVAYQRLKEGGEVTMLPSFAKEDYGEFRKKAKKMGIPVAAMQEKGKENTLSVFFNVKDEQAINAIVQDIVREKLKQPEQSERMNVIEKDHVEAFQMACESQDIPVSFMGAKDGVKCIYNAVYEKQVQAVIKDFQKMQAELSHTSVSIEQDKRDRLKIVVEDAAKGKRLSMNFCTKAKLERVLQEQLGYSEVKVVQAANALTANLSEQQRNYYLSGSRTLEQMNYFEPHIRLENENLLTEPFSFAKMKFRNEDTPHLTITSGSGDFVVLSGRMLNREETEKNIRQYLKVEDPETITAILNKAEKLGFVDVPKQVQYKEYQIERDSQSTFKVRGGSTEVRMNLDDKLTARKQLMDSFGMTAAKADKIIAKAQKQSMSRNLLDKAKQKAAHIGDTLRHKKRDRGSRK